MADIIPTAPYFSIGTWPHHGCFVASGRQSNECCSREAARVVLRAWLKEGVITQEDAAILVSQIPEAWPEHDKDVRPTLLHVIIMYNNEGKKWALALRTGNGNFGLAPS